MGCVGDYLILYYEDVEGDSIEITLQDWKAQIRNFYSITKHLQHFVFPQLHTTLYFFTPAYYNVSTSIYSGLEEVES